jgi:hypothetical protein
VAPVRPGLYTRVGSTVTATVVINGNLTLLGGAFSLTITLPLTPVMPASGNLNGGVSFSAASGVSLGNFQVGITGSASGSTAVIAGQAGGVAVITTISLAATFQYNTTDPP